MAFVTISPFAINLFNQVNLGAIDSRHQGSLVVFTDHCINLPVANTRLGFDHIWSLLNADSLVGLKSLNYTSADPIGLLR